MMFGGPPMMSAPTFAPTYPPGGYGQPAFVNQPMAPSYPGGMAAAPQAAPPSVPAVPAAPRQPIFRGKRPDDPDPVARPTLADRKPAPLVMPTPEQLGIDASRLAVGGADWTAAHRRLQQLGVTCFHLETLPDGGCRFVCMLPTGTQSRLHRVEVQAATEAEAVCLALDDAEQWAGQKK